MPLTRLKLMAGGLKSLLPIPQRKYTGTGGTDNARYCYAIWLRHLSLLRAAGMQGVPAELVEIGPGDSLGTGLAAMLCGTRRYAAIDVLPHTDLQREHAMLDELVRLFAADTPIPNDAELPGVYPRLPRYGKPSELGIPASARSPERLAELHAAIDGANDRTNRQAAIRYLCPWTQRDLIAPGSADLVLGQGVLQDVEDKPGPNGLAALVSTLYAWLKPGGYASNHTDFGQPGTRKFWNSHWAIPDWQWRIIVGRRPYYVNRVPLSRYLELMQEVGFEVKSVVTDDSEAGLPRERLAARFRKLPDADLKARCGFIAVRRPPA